MQTLKTRPWDKYSFPAFGVIFGGIGVLLLGAIVVVPWLREAIMPLFWFAAKVLALLFLFIWIRGTLPRFRYDQLMKFTWLFLFPLALVQLMLTGLVVALGD
jgi:NADH-quinone oxidoreductase subunit H